MRGTLRLAGKLRLVSSSAIKQAPKAVTNTKKVLFTSGALLSLALVPTSVIAETSKAAKKEEEDDDLFDEDFDEEEIPAKPSPKIASPPPPKRTPSSIPFPSSTPSPSPPPSSTSSKPSTSSPAPADTSTPAISPPAAMDSDDLELEDEPISPPVRRATVGFSPDEPTLLASHATLIADSLYRRPYEDEGDDMKYLQFIVQLAIPAMEQYITERTAGIIDHKINPKLLRACAFSPLYTDVIEEGKNSAIVIENHLRTGIRHYFEMIQFEPRNYPYTVRDSEKFLRELQIVGAEPIFLERFELTTMQGVYGIAGIGLATAAGIFIYNLLKKNSSTPTASKP